jgi:acetyltransferase-like isoleucine patch superfamily enzyme
MDIEPGCEIERSAWIDRTWPAGIHIGAGTYVGLEAVILTHDFTRGVYLDTRIGRGCIIGARAIVMPGCTIGDGSIIHPGAVVTRDVTGGSTAIGNPARTSPAEGSA